VKAAFVAVIVLHGLIHLMGPAKAFGQAELAQLTTPISRTMGVAWLAAAVALLATAALLALSFRSWWIMGLIAVVLSQAVIVSAWGDAKFGTIANVLLLAGVVYGFMSQGPLSFAAEYRREVEARLAEAPPSPAPLTEADLAPLPEPVQRYLRLTGSVGQPRPHHVRATWRGRIRSGPEDPWMAFTAEQYNFLAEPSRFFLMDARRAGLPVDVLHAYRDGQASMRVRLLSMIPLVDERGPAMTRAETVTLLNDMALFAPPALADPTLQPDLRWEAIDARSARVRYTVGDNEVSAVLEFNEADELVDFVSDDRLAASPDGSEFRQWRWSTPVRDYRSFGDLRVMSRGEGLWHAPEGTYSYIELELLELEINGGG
jgi:hypothetical protein